MPNHQTLAKSIQGMTAALEKIKTDELTLTQMMEEFTNAIHAYQQFELNVSNENLDVKEVKMTESGELKESAFEWRDM